MSRCIKIQLTNSVSVYLFAYPSKLNSEPFQASKLLFVVVLKNRMGLKRPETHSNEEKYGPQGFPASIHFTTLICCVVSMASPGGLVDSMPD